MVFGLRTSLHWENRIMCDTKVSKDSRGAGIGQCTKMLQFGATAKS